MQEKIKDKYPSYFQQQRSQQNADQDSASHTSAFSKQRNSESLQIEIPQINLPKGGGALKGIDEKFQVNAANGTAGFSIPLPITPGRNNFQPSLALGYDSGSGNTPFGLGWNIDLPSIQRKTDKKLPKYEDGTEGDVFMFSGAEDLVPFLTDNAGNWEENIKTIGPFTIKRFRPRTEGLFARIEKVTRETEDTFYWKVTTRDNIVTFFGKSGTHRIADPDDPQRIFEWLPEFSFDDKGNCLVFEYKEENLDGVENNLHEKNRMLRKASFTNKFLKRILYGNLQPYFPDITQINEVYNSTVPAATDYLFELIFDYGEHTDDQPAESVTWSSRLDPFSNYRPGFEIRTYRLCQRVLMFHHFTNQEFGLEDNETRVPYLVRSLDFNYVASSLSSPQQSELTYLKSLAQTGYKKEGNGYIKKSLPTLDFEYEPLQWNKEIKTIAQENIANAPAGLTNYHLWVDFYGEGITGILTEQADAWYYKSNLGDGNFTPAYKIFPKPSFTGLSTGVLQLQDLNADGKRQVTWMDSEVQGYFELTDDNEWLPFQTIDQRLNIDQQDAHVRFIDLNGDGRPDLVVSEENALTWYPSMGPKGFEKKESAYKPFDEDKGPAIVFTDGIESIFLADMNGDGLTDIVRIRNGEIAYWSNMGYGKFGSKINMSDAPYFDHPDHYNPAYLHLADISGTGAIDILYLGKDHFRAWLNCSGNAWSEATNIEPFLPVALPNQLAVIDLLGNGTSCIVWSSPLPAAHHPMHYIDLMGGKKPHLLRTYKNNLGKETVIEYKSSTHFYLNDKKGGQSWTTKLPFPVQCVSKIEVIDRVTDLRFTNLYTYHHGFYDHDDREFRGFGRVEQRDTEEYEYLKNAEASNATEIQFHEPPILTKTWFHTGAYQRQIKLRDQYLHEYWYNNGDIQALFGAGLNKEYALPDALLPEDLTLEELKEAHRACKGMMLRQEVFSLDGSEKEAIPYSVVTSNCIIQKLQPKLHNNHAAFLVQKSEEITFAYDRNVNDPRVTHSLNLEINDLGKILKSAAVVYPRKSRPADLLEDKIWEQQNKQHIILEESAFTSDIDSAIAFRLRLPYETKTFELTGVTPEPTKGYFTIEDLKITATEIAYEQPITVGRVEKRLIEHIKTIYRNNDVRNVMPEGKHDTLGLVFESYQLAFTPTLLDHIYKQNNEPSKVDAAMLLEARYVPLQNDGNFWIGSGTVQLVNEVETTLDAAQRFFTPLSYTDPFGSVTTVSYYSNYFLFVQQTKDALENTVTSEAFDFKTLLPQRVTDANGNITAVVTDMLGLVVGSAVMGKGSEGDNLEQLEADLSQLQIELFLNDPFTHGKGLLKQASSRIVYDFSKLPCVAATIVREEHHANDPDSKLQYNFQYSDGLGHIALLKIMAEPGDAPHRDENGHLVRQPDGTLDLQPTPHRWVGDGRTILNNKSKPVKQYQPYFSNTHLYEDEPQLRESGVTPVLHYDAVGRLVKTFLPDDTFLKTEYDAWIQKAFDANDTVLESKWFSDRMNNVLDVAFIKEGRDPVKEKTAAQRTTVHAETPTVTHIDSLGRAFYTVSHNRFTDFTSNTVKEEFYPTQTIFDIEGNIRMVIDAAGNQVMEYKYDLLGHIVYQNSMDAGERWLLNNCMGQPQSGWDNKAQQLTTSYDILQRPQTISLLKENHLTVTEKFEYRDTKGLTASQLEQQQDLNLIGKAVTHYDGAGIMQLLQCDFKSNPLKMSRQLCLNYKVIPDWKVVNDVILESEVFTSINAFDALNRPLELRTPHTANLPATTIIPHYTEGNLLNGIRAAVRGSQTETDFVVNIKYDAKGQRTSIIYGNQTKTKYFYDSTNFRLIRLFTTGNGGSTVLQDLRYTYDPVGNVTHIEERANEPLFFDGVRIEPLSEYIYDAIYQLRQASGREHAGQNRVNETAANTNRRNFPLENIPGFNDSQALRKYIQQFAYDAVGNIRQLQHIAGAGSFTRMYCYNNNEADRIAFNIDPNTTKNNQLLATFIGNSSPTSYRYDEHGNLLNLPHLQEMQWNYQNQLRSIDLGGGGQAFYIYDASGQRIRKVIERLGGRKEERIYLGVFEWFRQTDATAIIQEATETLHIMDDTDRIALVEIKTIQNGVPLPGNNAENKLIRYQYGNHLGSSSLELDDLGTIISYEEYHPFGTTSYHATSEEIRAVAKRYRYTGMERDEESGLQYHIERYYAPWLGRWISCDPLGLQDGVNVYQYVRGNPLMLVDTTGTNGKKKKSRPTVKAKLNDVVPYKVKIKDRGKIGKNVQKDHPIAQGKLRHMLTDPKGKVHYDPMKDPAVVAETGKATDTSPAKPHTQKTHIDPQADVKEIKRIKAEGIKHVTTDIIEPSRNAAVRSGMKPQSVDKAIWGQLDNLFSMHRLEQIGGILKKLGPVGTFIGVFTAISLLAEGKVWAATKELLFAVPVIGDILDIGSSLWGWITGNGDDDEGSVDVDDYLASEDEVKSLTKDMEIIAVTWEDPTTASGGGGESASAGQSANPGLQRLVDVGGLTIEFKPVKPGSPLQPGTIMRIPNGPWMQWDEYLILDFVILTKKIQMLPTSMGATLQLRF